MSIFSVAVSLTGPPQLNYGFWYSYDSTHTRGHMLTLSNFLATYLSLALGLLVAWAVSRLWRIGCALLFYFSDVPEPSWEESQNNVLIVNTKDAIDGVIDSYSILKSRAKAYRDRIGTNNLPLGDLNKYRRARYVIISTMILAFITVGLKLAIPLLIALVPLSRLGIVVPRSCGHVAYTPGTTTEDVVPETIVREARWANAAFAVLDTGGSHSVDVPGSPSGSDSTTFPELVASFDDSCPPDVPGCSAQHPFTFSGQYTLSTQHFSLNVATPFSLRVSDTCYRPYSRLARIEATGTNSTAFGFYYGTYDEPDGHLRNYTDKLDKGQATASSYAIQKVYALANRRYSIGWLPDSILTQGGDTTLLFYYIGGVSMKNHSSDPLFATAPTENPTSTRLPISEVVVAPIICDTKYVFCDTNGSSRNCSNPGGLYTLLDWLEDRQGTTWMDIRQLFETSLAGPPIFRASFGSAAPLAAQSVDSGIQYAPGKVTAFRELSRLSAAGMVTLASYAQISATGYWGGLAHALPFTTEADPGSLCNRVIMESSLATTIPVVPYLLFVIFSVLIVVISYSASFRLSKKILMASFDRLSNIWALHLPGQLHREATEMLQGRGFKLVSLTGKWPNAPYQSGPTIITGATILTRKGAERFGSGNTGLVENRPETAGAHH